MALLHMGESSGRFSQKPPHYLPQYQNLVMQQLLQQTRGPALDACLPRLGPAGTGGSACHSGGGLHVSHPSWQTEAWLRPTEAAAA